MKKRFNGIVVPMITPLMVDRQIDIVAVGNIMSLFAENSISPLVLGTTGEGASIGVACSLALVKAAVAAKRGEQIIFAGLAGNNVDFLIESAKRYSDLGVDAVVSTLPSYYLLTPVQMEKFYIRLADESPCPVLMYNIKATTQMSIPLEVVEKLSAHPNIAGLKDSERDMQRLENCINTYRNRADFSFFCGWGAKSLNSLRMGADGIVPSTGNIIPEVYKTLYDAFLQENFELAEKIQKDTDVIALDYQQGRSLGESLAVLKAMMQKRGLCWRYMMPPLTEI